MVQALFVYERPDLVHRAVCETLCAVFPTLSPEAVLSSDRINHATAWLRQVGMYLTCKLGLTQAQTGTLFQRDRSTVSHAVQLAEIEATNRPQTAAFFQFLEDQVRQTLEGYSTVELNGGSLPPSLREGIVYHG